MAFGLMLIWVLIMGSLNKGITISSETGEDDICGQRISWGRIFTIFGLPLLLTILCSEFGDRSTYIRKFVETEVSWSSIGSAAMKWQDSGLYYGIQFVFKLLFGNHVYLWIALVVLVQFISVAKILKKYSPDFAMSAYLFIASTMMISWMCNGTRQFMAVALLFVQTDWILRKKWGRYIVFLILVMGLGPICSVLGMKQPPWFLGGIHESVIIMIPIVFCITGRMFNKRLFITIIVLAVLFIGGSYSGIMTSLLEPTTFSEDLKYVANDSGANPFRFLVAMAPVVLVWIKRQKLERMHVPRIIHLCINASIVTAALYAVSVVTSGIYVGRLPIYTEMYNLILIPWAIEKLYPEQKSFLKTCVYVAYMGYFFYQVNIAWDGSPYMSEILGIG